MKPIRLSDHARAQLRFRGGFAWEVTEAIRTSPWEPAERGRRECRVVVTVYVYYLLEERR